MANWVLTIDVSPLVAGYKKGAYEIPQLADLVTDKLLGSGWLKLSPYPDTLRDTIEGLRNSTTQVEYIARFGSIYDAADEDFVWIECG